MFVGRKMADTGVVTIDLDEGQARILGAMIGFDDAYLNAGFFEQDTETDERGEAKSLAEIAAIQEFGAPKASIPERSFMRSTFDAHEDDYTQAASEALGSVIDGDITPMGAMIEVGERMSGDMRLTIYDMKTPPNAPSTIARKGFNDPLVHTGTMARTLRYVAVLGEETLEQAKG